MKIVTYNVNGLRPRISQFGSLRRLLDALDADIICFQETKLSRQELRADLVKAEGYESFFSCTRSTDKGRTGYSGVATFCRVKSAFTSDEVMLPVSAEEGFTGIFKIPPVIGLNKSEYPSEREGLGNFSAEELLKIDGEGRCIITDHEHFVLFNVYGPRAEHDDTERIQYKLNFFNILQKRWESLLHQGRRVFVVGDLNIAPYAIDRCDPGPDFEKNEFRTWFRSLLMKNGGSFFDVFREKHPDRREAYTCWPTNSGGEEFNFGSRIDHILTAGPCLHQEENQAHSFVTCHVKECDVLEQFKRWKPGSLHRHSIKAGNVKLEGSDHAPVYFSLVGIPNIQLHSTPPLSTRYYPQVYGQQTLVSMFVRRQAAEEINLSGRSKSLSENYMVAENCSQPFEGPLQACRNSTSDVFHERELRTSEGFSECTHVQSSSKSSRPNKGHTELSLTGICKKKARRSQCSQLSLKSFFETAAGTGGDVSHFSCENDLIKGDISIPSTGSNEVLHEGGQCDAVKVSQPENSTSNQEDGGVTPQLSENEKNNPALVEWQRIRQFMQTSIPLCKGHHEPCVSRIVKKSGPNFGCRFYTCARAEGPASNREANCGFFKWATAKHHKKRALSVLARREITSHNVLLETILCFSKLKGYTLRLPRELLHFLGCNLEDMAADLD